MDTPAHTPQPMDIGTTYSRAPNLRPTVTDFPIDMPDIAHSKIHLTLDEVI
jgi:hypothetical protein